MIEKIPFQRRFGFPLAIVIISLLLILGWSVNSLTRRFIFENLVLTEVNKARVSNFQTCLNPQEESDNNLKSVFDQDDEIFVCGTLIAEQKLSLSIYWLRLPDKAVVYQNLYGETFGPGYFYSKLKSALPPGDYQVDIYYHRVLLDTIKFTINKD